MKIICTEKEKDNLMEAIDYNGGICTIIGDEKCQCDDYDCEVCFNKYVETEIIDE